MKLSKGHDSGGWQLACLSLIQDKCPVKGHDPEIWKREICVSLRKVPVGFTLQNQLTWLLPFFAWLWWTTYCSAITSYNSFEVSTTGCISLLFVFFLGQTQMLSSEWLRTWKQTDSKCWYLPRVKQGCVKVLPVELFFPLPTLLYDCFRVTVGTYLLTFTFGVRVRVRVG